MLSLQTIEQEISRLPAVELQQFQEWFESFSADRWDRQLENDITAGKLDELANQAIDSLQQGECKSL